MKNSYKIIVAIITALSLSTLAIADVNAKSHQKKYHASKTKKAHKSKHHAKKNTKAVKEFPKAEDVKPVENNNVGGEMKTRIIQ